MTTNLQIADIRTDGGTQSRAGLNQDIVRDYAQEMQAGAEFPPVTVFHDGSAYWLADGFHRIAAAREAGLIEFPADVRQGTRRDAVLHSVGANGRHGLRRTNEDKRRAVIMLLEDEEWAAWSNYEIARRCDVSEGFVRGLRPHYVQNVVSETRYTTKHGTAATMNTANIGHKPAPVRYAAEPDFNQDTPDAPTIDPALTPGKLYRCEDCGAQVKKVDVEWKTGRQRCDACLRKYEEELRRIEDNIRRGYIQGALSLRYRPGQLAQCTHPQCTHLNTSRNGGLYDNWTLTDKPGVWRCPHGHRKADPLMRIIEETPATRAARLSNSGPWTAAEKQYLSAVRNLAEANHDRSAEAQARRFGDLSALHSSASCEWYTPGIYVEAARALMGEITLDPASCELANQTVKAMTFYSREENGLAQPWSGRVWLNPPYGRTDANASSQGAWAARLIEEYEARNVQEALLLVSAATSEKWFQPLWNYALCFVTPRINFDVPPGAPPANGSNHGSVIVYFGENHGAFAKIFGKFGRVVLPAPLYEKAGRLQGTSVGIAQ